MGAGEGSLATWLMALSVRVWLNHYLTLEIRDLILYMKVKLQTYFFSGHFKVRSKDYYSDVHFKLITFSPVVVAGNHFAFDFHLVLGPRPFSFELFLTLNVRLNFQSSYTVIICAGLDCISPRSFLRLWIDKDWED